MNMNVCAKFDENRLHQDITLKTTNVNLMVGVEGKSCGHQGH